MLVLHLDDDVSIRLSSQAILEDAGFTYFGSDEWAVISERLFALKGESAVLIADLNMPGIRGEDFCRTAIKHCPNLAVVLHSGSSKDSLATVAARLGCHYVEKAEGPYKVIEVIHRAVLSRKKH